jgi:Ragulator complex protein LAMTOR5
MLEAGTPNPYLSLKSRSRERASHTHGEIVSSFVKLRFARRSYNSHAGRAEHKTLSKMSSNDGQQRSQSASLVDSLVSGDREGVGGILCNDSSGLCLASRGTMMGETGNSGVYTSLVRLASQLHQQGDSNGDATPLITIETEKSAVLVKEYDGHVIAVRVPSVATPEGTATSEDRL